MVVNEVMNTPQLKKRADAAADQPPPPPVVSNQTKSKHTHKLYNEALLRPPTHTYLPHVHRPRHRVHLHARSYPRALHRAVGGPDGGGLGQARGGLLGVRRGRDAGLCCG